MSQLNFYLNILSCQSENLLASTPDLVLITHLQKHPLITYAGASSKAADLKKILGLTLLPYFMYAN